jgi:hypothetical protein
MDSVKQYLAKIGKKGGKNRVKNQTAEQRQESARRAAQARWAKKKGKSNAPLRSDSAVAGD